MNQEPEYKAEFDFRDLLRKPEKLFGFSYLYFLIILVGIGLFYILNLNTVGNNSVAAVAVTDSSALEQDIPLQSPRVIPPVDVLKVGVSSPEYISKGRELFKANCASCHGDNGMGDGPSGMLTNPKPRNFHSPEGWTNGSKIVQIYKTLQEGIVKNGMASFSYLPPEDRFALIHFVRSLYGNYPVDTPDELKQLDATYALSKGLSVPGQIPVKRAIHILVSESDSDLNFILRRTEAAKTSETQGAVILRRVAMDEQKVMTSIYYGKNSVSTLNDFIRYTSVDPIHLGFKPAVMQLSGDEWMTMYKYLDGLMKEKER